MHRIANNEALLHRHGIEHLDPSLMKCYPAFAVGTDPHLGIALDPFHEPNAPIGLVATSGLRAISLACQLGNPQNLPQIVLIDFSIHVFIFWEEIKTLFQNHQDSKDFLHDLPDWIAMNKHLYIDMPDDFKTHKRITNPEVEFLNQNIGAYFQALLDKYPYEYVRAVVINTINIIQVWENTDLFVKVKAMLAEQGISKIFVYASNIVACNPVKELVILNNIHSLSPVLAIHSSRSAKYQVPKYAYLVTDSEPSAVIKQIFPKRVMNVLFNASNMELRDARIEMVDDGEANLRVQPVQTVEQQPEPDFTERDQAIAKVGAYRNKRSAEGFFRGAKFIKFGEKDKLEAADALIKLLGDIPANTCVSAYIQMNMAQLDNHLHDLINGELGTIFFELSNTNADQYTKGKYTVINCRNC